MPQDDSYMRSYNEGSPTKAGRGGEESHASNYCRYRKHERSHVRMFIRCPLKMRKDPGAFLGEGVGPPQRQMTHLSCKHKDKVKKRTAEEQEDD